MAKKIKKIMSMMLVLCMMASMLSVGVFAADGTVVENESSTVDGVTTDVTTTTTTTTDENGNTTVTVTIETKTEGTNAEGTKVNSDETRVETTVTDAKGNVISDAVVADGSETKEWTEDVQPGQAVPEVELELKDGETTSNSVTSAPVVETTEDENGTTTTTTTSNPSTTSSTAPTITLAEFQAALEQLAAEFIGMEIEWQYQEGYGYVGNLGGNPLLVISGDYVTAAMVNFTVTAEDDVETIADLFVIVCTLVTAAPAVRDGYTTAEAPELVYSDLSNMLASLTEDAPYAFGTLYGATTMIVLSSEEDGSMNMTMVVSYTDPAEAQ
ncbi:MAG: hypothetical protein IJE07_05730 [Clostridia bacterium]|nr:hypothetical protein [Clostridia bacterium]